MSLQVFFSTNQESKGGKLQSQDAFNVKICQTGLQDCLALFFSHVKHFE